MIPAKAGISLHSGRRTASGQRKCDCPTPEAIRKFYEDGQKLVAYAKARVA